MKRQKEPALKTGAPTKRVPANAWLEDSLDKVLAKALPEHWATDFSDSFASVWRKALKPVVPRSWPASFQARLLADVQAGFLERLRGEDVRGPLRKEVRDWMEDTARAMGYSRHVLLQGARIYADRRVEDVMTPLVEAAAQEASEHLAREVSGTLAEVKQLGALSPKALHRFASRYNWDEGLLHLVEAIRSPHCALGTALLLYWRGQPHFFRQYAKQAEVPGHAIENYDLLREIEKRVAKNGFEHHGIAYDPREDGNDLTRAKGPKPATQRELPEAMYAATTKRDVLHFPPPIRGVRGGRQALSGRSRG